MKQFLVLNHYKQAFSLLRAFCGFHLLVFIFLVQWPNFSQFYSNHGMVEPQFFVFFSKSVLFSIWDYEVLKVLLFGFNSLFAMMFFLGVYARYIHLPLFLLNSFFLVANPFVIHEPQQLTQILLFVLFFIPYEQHFTVRPSKRMEKFENSDSIFDRRISTVLMLFLGGYYLLAGLKKLPDPAWLDGSAVSNLVSFPYLGKTNAIAEVFKVGWISAIASWSALLFEIGFVFLIFTPLRWLVVIIGCLFHLSNFFIFEVGTFWLAMLMWYPVLLVREPKTITSS